MEGLGVSNDIRIYLSRDLDTKSRNANPRRLETAVQQIMNISRSSTREIAKSILKGQIPVGIMQRMPNSHICDPESTVEANEHLVVERGM
jgi:hypothetical protein